MVAIIPEIPPMAKFLILDAPEAAATGLATVPAFDGVEDIFVTLTCFNFKIYIKKLVKILLNPQNHSRIMY